MLCMLLECDQEGRWATRWYQYWVGSPLHNIDTLGGTVWNPQHGVAQHGVEKHDALLLAVWHCSVWHWWPIVWYCCLYCIVVCALVILMWYCVVLVSNCMVEKPCWYQYWVLRGDSHGEVQVQFSRWRRGWTASVSSRSMASQVLSWSMQLQSVSNILGEGNNIVVSFFVKVSGQRVLQFHTFPSKLGPE